MLYAYGRLRRPGGLLGEKIHLPGYFFRLSRASGPSICRTLKIVYASRGVSGTLNKRMCGKIVKAHVFKMAGKITHFLALSQAKNLKTKNHAMVSSHRPKKFAATQQLLKCMKVPSKVGKRFSLDPVY